MILITTSYVENDNRKFVTSWLAVTKSTKFSITADQLLLDNVDIPEAFFKDHRVFYVVGNKLYMAYDKENNLDKLVPTTIVPKDAYTDNDYLLGATVLATFDPPA